MVTFKSSFKPILITGTFKKKNPIISFATVQRDVLEEQSILKEACECGTMYITAENDT